MGIPVIANVVEKLKSNEMHAILNALFALDQYISGAKTQAFSNCYLCEKPVIAEEIQKLLQVFPVRSKKKQTLCFKN